MTSPRDHALAVIKAALNLIPSVGGALASLIGDYVPTSTQRSIDKTMTLLGEKLTSLEGRIDVDAVNKEDFSELFKSCYLVVVRRRDLRQSPGPAGSDALGLRLRGLILATLTPEVWIVSLTVVASL